jgi:two-component sensor histidine kinase
MPDGACSTYLLTAAFLGPARMKGTGTLRNWLRTRAIASEISAIARSTRAIRYGATVVLVAVFFLFSVGAKVASGPFEFLILIPPVLLASVLFDRESGFLATGLSVVAIASQLDWPADPVGDLVALTTFAIVALFITVFCEALRSALERGAAAQQELQLLPQEQRHRIKNDLASLSSLIALQARSQSSPPVRAALESAVSRLHVIAEGHDHLQFATGDQTRHWRR